ncbi:hypothetical protein CEUSTIGMA_g8663.t1 [Chlamydomonas eustigma]|uniref:Uncharacterized protein n=1 Tax=Chlamydomonas eustigma TaxID=1157962 RepID=A0A250XDW1_9CHLO|nr:hypothetical protein CEUSTIGMA_g8663.t1 [Chlamydomonas eustigma]|eukprot:GAX81231.1 hypothetical protein CEUSTIGMA_g8663.t1 [Chlamydomonas eustigma]
MSTHRESDAWTAFLEKRGQNEDVSTVDRSDQTFLVPSHRYTSPQEAGQWESVLSRGYNHSNSPTTEATSSSPVDLNSSVFLEDCMTCSIRLTAGEGSAAIDSSEGRDEDDNTQATAGEGSAAIVSSEGRDEDDNTQATAGEGSATIDSSEGRDEDDNTQTTAGEGSAAIDSSEGRDEDDNTQTTAGEGSAAIDSSEARLPFASAVEEAGYEYLLSS